MKTPRIRRPRLSYANVTATLALVIATSMGGAYAHGMIGSGQIKNNAVKSKHIAGKQVKTGDLAGSAVATAKLKNKAVKLSKLAPANRPTHETQWRFGGHNFVAEDQLLLKLPGLTRAQVQESHWEISVLASIAGPPAIWYNIPLAYGDEAEGPIGAVVWSSIAGYTGAIALVGDTDDDLDLISVSGIRVLQTTRPTATKAASKLTPRSGARIRLP